MLPPSALPPFRGHTHRRATTRLSRSRPRAPRGIERRGLGCSFVLIHHSTKGNQSGKTITDVGAGSQSRTTDTHLIRDAREHTEPEGTAEWFVEAFVTAEMGEAGDRAGGDRRRVVGTQSKAAT